MEQAVNRLTPIALRLSITLLLGVTWIIPAYNKISGGGVPPWFGERFGGTILAQFPGLAASYWSIVVLEAIAALLVVASLATGEFLGKKGAPLLKAAALLSILLFIQLGFGQRLSGDNDGAASLFVYTVGGFVLVFLLDWLDRRPEPATAL